MIAYFRDEDGWGLGCHVAALNKGYDTCLFDDDESLALCPSDSTLFVRMSHKEVYRWRYKQRIEAWSRIHPSVPGRYLAKLYDDKISQQEALGKWMPPAFIIKSEQDAYTALRTLTVPFVSKTSAGAGSKGVRLVTNSEEAIKDVQTRTKEAGALVWQVFCDGNKHDYRCLVVGNERLWIKRINRESSPFASGSGNIVPMAHKDVPPKMMTFVEAFVAQAKKEGGCLHDSFMPLLGIDLIYMNGEPVLTEITTSWTLPVYFKSEWLDGRKGHAFFDVVAEQMEAARA